MNPSCLVDFVFIALVQVNNKNDIISEAADPVHSRHDNDKAEEIIDDRVQEAIKECSLGHMFNTLQLIVDVELGCH